MEPELRPGQLHHHSGHYTNNMNVKRLDRFKNISFNVLGVESGVPRDIAQRDTSLEVWKRYGDQIEGTRHDVIYEFDDRNEPRHEVQFPYGTEDPRDGDISSE